jgi:hypothetical protein
MDNILDTNDINTIFNYYYDSNKNLKQHLYNDFINNQINIVKKIIEIESDNKINKYEIALLFASQLITSTKKVIRITI